MEGVLAASRLVILPDHNAVTGMAGLQGLGDSSRNGDDPVRFRVGEVIKTFKMPIGNNDRLAGIVAYEERTDEDGHQIVPVDDIRLTDHCAFVFNPIECDTDRADVIGGRVVMHEITLGVDGNLPLGCSGI